MSERADLAEGEIAAVDAYSARQGFRRPSQGPTVDEIAAVDAYSARFVPAMRNDETGDG
jgi:hypothetical protein